MRKMFKKITALTLALSMSISLAFTSEIPARAETNYESSNAQVEGALEEEQNEQSEITEEALGEVAESDTSEPDINQINTSQVDAGQVNAGQSDAGQVNTSQPDISQSDADISEELEDEELTETQEVVKDGNVSINQNFGSSMIQSLSDSTLYRFTVGEECDLTLYLRGRYKNTSTDINLYYMIYDDNGESPVEKEYNTKAIKTGTGANTYEVFGNYYDYKETIHFEKGNYSIRVCHDRYRKLSITSDYYFNALLYFESDKEYIDEIKINGLVQPFHEGTPLSGNEPTVEGDILTLESLRFTKNNKTATLTEGMLMGNEYSVALKLKLNDTSKYEFGNRNTGYVSGYKNGEKVARKIYYNGEVVDFITSSVSVDATYITVTIKYTDMIKSHDDLNFDKLLTSDYLSTVNYVLPSGNYYLTGDVLLAHPIKLATSSTVNLCLSGHRIYDSDTNQSAYSGSDLIEVVAGSTLNMYDCAETKPGYIDGTRGDSCNRFAVAVYGTFNMYGGRIANCYRGTEGSAVNIYTEGSFNMYGGSIDNNGGGTNGIINLEKSAYFKMYGGTITKNDTTADGAAIHQSYATGDIIIYDGKITNNKSTGNGSAINGYAVYLRGGEITGNTVSSGKKGAGIFVKGVLVIGNKPVVKGNTDANDNASNVFMAGKTYGASSQSLIRFETTDLMSEIHIDAENVNERISNNFYYDYHSIFRSDRTGYAVTPNKDSSYHYLTLSNVIPTKQIVIMKDAYNIKAGEKRQIEFYRVPEDANDEIEISIKRGFNTVDSGYYSDYFYIDGDGNINSVANKFPSKTTYFYVTLTAASGVSSETSVIVTDGDPFSIAKTLTFNQKKDLTLAPDTCLLFKINVPEDSHKVEFDLTADLPEAAVTIVKGDNSSEIYLTPTKKDDKYIISTTRKFDKGYYYIYVTNNHPYTTMNYSIIAIDDFSSGESTDPVDPVDPTDPTDPTDPDAKIIPTEKIIINPVNYTIKAGVKNQIKYERVPSNANDNIEVNVTYGTKTVKTGSYADYFVVDTKGNVTTKAGKMPEAYSKFTVTFKAASGVSANSTVIVTDYSKNRNSTKLLFNQEKKATVNAEKSVAYKLYAPEASQAVKLDYSTDVADSYITIVGVENNTEIKLTTTKKDGKYVIDTTKDLPEGNYLIYVTNVSNKNMNMSIKASHKYIKGKCQMPYWGEGGGYLIGVESFDNPNNSYYYEILILDCTLFAQGLNAWTASSGKGRLKAGDKARWWLWQPLYGYYWTLFRVYDKYGNLIDEECYGFANI